MPLRNTDQTYGSVTRTLHWLTALVILTAIPLGIVANNLPTDTDAALRTTAILFSLHKTLGVLAFMVGTIRTLSTVIQPKPTALHPDRPVETALAEAVHWVLYLSLILVPLTGWAHHAATTGFAPILWPFGQTLPFVPQTQATADLFESLHWLFTKVLAAAIVFHVAGALKHMLIDKDETLGRMAYGRAPVEPIQQPQRQSRAPAIAAIVLYATALGAGTLMGQSPVAPQQTELVTPTSEWQVESGTLSITIRQLGQDVTGTFADWTAAITFDENATARDMGAITATILIQSLTLGAVTEQAMGPEVFDATTYPTADFEAVIVTNETGFAADGTLTLKGRTVPVNLPFFLELEDDRAIVSGTTTLDRRNYGIAAGYTDQASLGFPVVVAIELQAVRGP